MSKPSDIKENCDYRFINMYIKNKTKIINLILLTPSQLVFGNKY